MRTTSIKIPRIRIGWIIAIFCMSTVIVGVLLPVASKWNLAANTVLMILMGLWLVPTYLAILTRRPEVEGGWKPVTHEQKLAGVRGSIWFGTIALGASVYRWFTRGLNGFAVACFYLSIPIFISALWAWWLPERKECDPALHGRHRPKRKAGDR